MPNVKNDGVVIHYKVKGRGPAILFHTGAGGDSRMWELAGYVDALPGFRKILLDQRGRGKSGRPTEVEDHRMDRFVSDVAAVLDDAGVEAAAVWGYSNGAMVGLAFGTAYPRRLTALLGTGSLAVRDYADLPPIPDSQAFIQENVAKGGVAQDVDRHMKDGHDRFPALIDANVRLGDPLMYALDRVAWRSWKGPRSLYPAFAAPVLMLTGEREDPDHETEKALALLPNARGVRIARAGHLSAFAESALSVPHALPFLREHLA